MGTPPGVASEEEIWITAVNQHAGDVIRACASHSFPVGGGVLASSFART